MKAILSDDPQAIEKLQRKIEYLERQQQYMKDINKGYKKNGKEWLMSKIDPETYRFYAREMEYSWNKGKFYPAWALSNNGATIRLTKQRLKKLKLNKE